MANDRYTTELKRMFEDNSPAKPTTRTRAEIEADIAEISTMLRGPLSNADRLCLVGDRQHLRKQLANLSS